MDSSAVIGSLNTGYRDPAPAKGMPAAEAVSQLHRRVDRLALICQAMWELVRDKTQLGDKELADKILEVDLRDGTTDGMIHPTIVECPHCHAKTNSRRATCIMCGVELSRPQQFEV